MASQQTREQPNGREPLPFADCIALLTQTRQALAGMRDVTWQASCSDPAEAIGVLGELALIADAAEVAVLAEVLRRGENTSGECPLTPHEWVSAYSRRYPTGRAAANKVKLATGVKDTDRARPAPAQSPDPDHANSDGSDTGTTPDNAATDGVSTDGVSTDGVSTDRVTAGDAEGSAAGDRDAGSAGMAFGMTGASGKRLPDCLAQAVLSGAAPLGAAAVAVAEMTRLPPDLQADAIGVVCRATPTSPAPAIPPRSANSANSVPRCWPSTAAPPTPTKTRPPPGPAPTCPPGTPVMAH